MTEYATKEDLMHVNAEVMAVQTLLFGVTMPLRNRDLGADILHEAFDYAEAVHMRAIDQKATMPIGAEASAGKILDILAGLRSGMLSD